MPAFRRSLATLLLSSVFALAAPLCFRASPAEQGSGTLLIVNAQLADGTGAPLREGAVRIRGDRIAGIGKLSPAPGEQTLDARGRPGK